MVPLENCTKSLSKINTTVQNLLQKTEKQEILPSVFYEANEITKYNSGESWPADSIEVIFMSLNNPIKHTCIYSKFNIIHLKTD